MTSTYIAIKNFILTNTYETFAPLVEVEESYRASEEEISSLVKKLHGQIKAFTESNMSEDGVRSVVVTYLTQEFGVKIFGVSGFVDTQKHVMRDDAWKRYRKGKGSRGKFKHLAN